MLSAILGVSSPLVGTSKEMHPPFVPFDMLPTHTALQIREDKIRHILFIHFSVDGFGLLPILEPFHSQCCYEHFYTGHLVHTGNKFIKIYTCA